MAFPDRWKLGEDMFASDNILDPITFEDVILAMHCNVPRNKVTPERVRAETREILNQRIEDFWFVLENNINEVVERVVHYGEGE